MEKFHILILQEAALYIQSLPGADQGIIKASIEYLATGDFEVVSTKQLKGKVRELIVGNHRITYFLFKESLYFVRGFQKKTQKTPKKHIEYTLHVLAMVKNTH